MKKCPFCAEEIQDDAIKCRFCGEFLDGRAAVKKNPKSPWYLSTSILIISLLCVGPFALPLLWFNPWYSLVKKIVYSVIVLIGSILLYKAFMSAVLEIDQYYKMIMPS